MTMPPPTAPSTPNARRFFRPNLRQATLILPRTGERVKRVVTLRDSSLDGPSHDDSGETAPLLRRRSSLAATREAAALSWRKLRTIYSEWLDFALSETGKSVAKCSVAYFLGSLATLVPAMAAVLGSQDGKHMVATVTVYFSPARSKGSMVEASIFAFIAFLYAAALSVTSMAVSVLFGDVFDQMALGHALVLIVFVGGGIGFIAFIKQRLADPLVNVACSLASLASITVLTKEGAVQAADFSFVKISQVLKMTIMGVLITMAICFLVFPISAKTNLRQNFIEATDAMGTMFQLIVRSFLSGSEDDINEKPFLLATDQHKKASTSLPKHLKEAKYEHYVSGTEKEYHIEAKMVRCIQRISQCIGGLRSAAAMQFSLLKQAADAHKYSQVESGQQTASALIQFDLSPGMISPRGDFGLAAIDEVPEDETVSLPDQQPHGQSRQDSVVSFDGGQTPGGTQSPALIFSNFISYLGPSMKSLAYTLKQILDDLPYGPAPDFQIAVNPKFRTSLLQAIELYSKSRREALSNLYKHKELNRDSLMESEADFEEVAASCGHFSFSMLDFAEQLKEYLDILDELQLEVEKRPHGRTWGWLNFWRKKETEGEHYDDRTPEQRRLIGENEEANLITHIPSPSDRPGVSTPDPEKQPRKVKLGYKIWNLLRVFRRDDTKFAIKVGMGAAIFALPSFIPSTRPFYQHWRGEWGLLSYMFVCSMTIGAANTTGYSRFIGTCTGALLAIAVWLISRGNAYVLGFFGWLMSLWTAYMIVAQGKGPMGRFIMLTYNLSALYSYSLSVKDSDHDDDEGGSNPWIVEITTHRVVAVLSGCLWGLIITRLVWPISARQRLKDGLSVLWLRMGLIWKRDPLALFLEGESPIAYMNMSEEFELQRFLSRLENLRISARSEYELRGPFADECYGKILTSTAKMLDAFHAMNVEIIKDLKASEGEVAMLNYTVRERAQLCSRISHLFSVLASSMKLEYPLNDALPNIEHTRDRLLARIFSFRKHEQAKIGTRDEDFALLYAYALVTGQLSTAINEVTDEIENLFGVLNEDLLKLQ